MARVLNGYIGGESGYWARKITITLLIAPPAASGDDQRSSGFSRMPNNGTVYGDAGLGLLDTLDGLDGCHRYDRYYCLFSARL